MKNAAWRKRSAAAPSPLQTKLAGRIVELVHERRFEAGHHITEEFLTQQFRVSRSPVRGALLLLEEKGIVEARSNHGYFLTKPGRLIEPKSLDIPQSEDDELYDRVAADQFADRLPEKFKEADLMRRYDVGRTPLHRVLVRMSEEGLVQRSPGRQWEFQPTLTSVQGHDDSYRFRLIIEPASLLEPTFAVDQTRLDACRRRQQALLKNAGKKGTETEFLNANAEFHQMLADFSHNRFIQQSVQSQNRLRRLAEYRATPLPVRVEESCGEHLAILDAVEGGDLNWASTLLHRHLDVSSKLRLAFKEQVSR